MFEPPKMQYIKDKSPKLGRNILLCGEILTFARTYFARSACVVARNKLHRAAVWWLRERSSGRLGTLLDSTLPLNWQSMLDALHGNVHRERPYGGGRPDQAIAGSIVRSIAWPCRRYRAWAIRRRRCTSKEKYRRGSQNRKRWCVSADTWWTLSGWWWSTKPSIVIHRRMIDFLS